MTIRHHNRPKYLHCSLRTKRCLRGMDYQTALHLLRRIEK